MQVRTLCDNGYEGETIGCDNGYETETIGCDNGYEGETIGCDNDLKEGPLDDKHFILKHCYLAISCRKLTKCGIQEVNYCATLDTNVVFFSITEWQRQLFNQN